MADDPKPASADDMVPGVHLKKGLRERISDDGQTAMFLFEVGNEISPRFAITIPVEGLTALRLMITRAIDRAQRASLSDNFMNFKKPQEVSVGSPGTIPNCVAISFDAGRETETSYLLPDTIGLNIGEALHKDIMGRMSENDRNAYLRRKSNMIVPATRKLILPGLGG